MSDLVNGIAILSLVIGVVDAIVILLLFVVLYQRFR